MVIASERRQFRNRQMDCPNCHRLIYSRQHKNCGYCGTALPAELLLTPAELAALKSEQREIDERLARMKAEEERERKEATQEQYDDSLRLLVPWL